MTNVFSYNGSKFCTKFKNNNFEKIVKHCKVQKNYQDLFQNKVFNPQPINLHICLSFFSTVTIKQHKKQLTLKIRLNHSFYVHACIHKAFYYFLYLTINRCRILYFLHGVPPPRCLHELFVKGRHVVFEGLISLFNSLCIKFYGCLFKF